MTEIKQGGPSVIVEAGVTKCLEPKGMLSSEARKDREAGKAWWQVNERRVALGLVATDPTANILLRQTAVEMAGQSMQRGVRRVR